MKLTGLPIYLVTICLSLYLLTLTFLNLLNIASKYNSQFKVKTDMYKVCENLFYNNAPNSNGRDKEIFLMDNSPEFDKCFDILSK